MARGGIAGAALAAVGVDLGFQIHQAHQRDARSVGNRGTQKARQPQLSPIIGGAAARCTYQKRRTAQRADKALKVLHRVVSHHWTGRQTGTGCRAVAAALLHQAPNSRGKIFALHEPDVDCISKGKARVRYEFGCKVSIATTIDEGFVVGMRAMPGNPYDGHTLAEALEQVETFTDCCPELAVVDRGYRGHGVTRTRVLISGMRRRMTEPLKAQLRRRSAIEAEIGHMKMDGRLARFPLKGVAGDAMFAVLCGCGHNIRKLLAYLRTLLRLSLAWLKGPIEGCTARNTRQGTFIAGA